MSLLSIIIVAIISFGIYVAFFIRTSIRAQNLHQQLPIESVNIVNSKTGDVEIEYNEKPKKLIKFPFGYDVFTAGNTMTDKTKHLSMKFDDKHGYISYDFVKRTVNYYYSQRVTKNNQTKVDLTYQITVSGKQGKLVKGSYQRSSEDKHLSNKQLFNEYIQKYQNDITTMNKQGITYDVLKQRAELDVKQAPKIKKERDWKKFQNKLAQYRGNIENSDKFDKKMKKDAFSTDKLTSDDWLRLVKLRVNQIGMKNAKVEIRTDSHSRKYTKTLQETIETNLIGDKFSDGLIPGMPVPDYKYADHDTFVLIHDDKNWYVAIFPRDDWVFKTTAIKKSLPTFNNDADQIGGFDQKHSFKNNKIKSPMDTVSDSYYMKSNPPTDAEIARNIRIYRLSKEPIPPVLFNNEKEPSM